MQIPNNAFVVVADGRKMLLFRNEGDAAYPNLVVEKAEDHINPKDSDQKTDAPGRASGGIGGRADTMDEVDFHQQEENRFAAEITDLLKTRALGNDFESLIIVAPPKTLGEMRKHYHGEVSKRLIGEIDKDLTGHSVPDIEKAIANA